MVFYCKCNNCVIVRRNVGIKFFYKYVNVIFNYKIDIIFIYICIIDFGIINIFSNIIFWNNYIMDIDIYFSYIRIIFVNSFLYIDKFNRNNNSIKWNCIINNICDNRGGYINLYGNFFGDNNNVVGGFFFGKYEGIFNRWYLCLCFKKIWEICYGVD